MTAIHTHHGHGHCNHCTHYCEPCQEVYCCKCKETWSKYGRITYVDWTYRPYTGPFFGDYTVRSGSTTADYKFGMTNNGDIQKVNYHTAENHTHMN